MHCRYSSRSSRDYRSEHTRRETVKSNFSEVLVRCTTEDMYRCGNKICASFDGVVKGIRYPNCTGVAKTMGLLQGCESCESRGEGCANRECGAEMTTARIFLEY